MYRRAKAIWDFEGINCSSRHIPGVKFAGLIHPGILGCAPSADVLQTWNEREATLISECATSHPNKIVAQPPQPQNVHAGTAEASVKEKVGKEGARTIPGRPEHGGNCDIKNLSRGSKVYLPVHVKGAKFSVGDLHFSQGDGEISFCGAIEMAGEITINVSPSLSLSLLLLPDFKAADAVVAGGVVQSHQERNGRHGPEIAYLHSRASGTAVRTGSVHLLRGLQRGREGQAALPRRHCRIPADQLAMHRVPQTLR